MKQDKYTQEVFKKLDGEGKATCEDCGNKSKITHAIVDHDTNIIKVVCHSCFESKYQAFLYSNNNEGFIQ